MKLPSNIEAELRLVESELGSRGGQQAGPSRLRGLRSAIELLIQTNAHAQAPAAERSVDAFEQATGLVLGSATRTLAQQFFEAKAPAATAPQIDIENYVRKAVNRVCNRHSCCEIEDELVSAVVAVFPSAAVTRLTQEPK